MLSEKEQKALIQQYGESDPMSSAATELTTAATELSSAATDLKGAAAELKGVTAGEVEQAEDTLTNGAEEAA
jgi:hypothetical protein